MIAAAACGALAWLAGHAVLALGRPTRRRHVLELEATALLVGLALFAALFTNLILAVGALQPWVGATLAVALAVPGAWGLRRNHALASEPVATPAAREPWTLLERVLLVGLLGFCALAIFAAASSPVQGFDAVFHYAYKGQLIFHEGIGGDAWMDQDGPVGRCMTHPDYPPGVPMLEVLVGYLRGGFDEDAARPLWSLFALAPAGLLFAALRPRGRTPALVAALLWISLPLLYYWRLPNEEPLLAVAGLLLGPEAAAARFPDAGPWQRAASWNLDATAGLPLAAFLFGAFLCLARLRRGRLASERDAGDGADRLAAGVLLAGVLLTKNEGLALVPLVLAALCVSPTAGTRWAGRVRALVPSGLVAGLLFGAWFVVRERFPTVDEDYGSRLTPAMLVASLDRADEVAAAFARAFGSLLTWNLLWPIFAAGLVWGLGTPRRLFGGDAWPAALVVFAGSAVYFAVMLVTPWDLVLLEGTGIPNRLLFHLAPLAVFAACTSLWELPETNPKPGA